VPEVIHDTNAMLAGMTPMLTAGEFAFCTTQDAELITRASPSALGWFKEEEGTTLILLLTEARTLGFSDAMPMRRIVLEVFSALDGVGLTAGVATALAQENIPCNMVAGYHHDHVFVPAAQAEQAQAVLIEVAARAQLRPD
jgi:uncharacterized protein